MNVLVTGGAGYIGSVVIEHLIARGHRAVAYDNLSRGHRLAVAPETPLVVGDLRERDKLIRALVEHQIEAVIHMAADSLVGESVAHPHKYFSNNVGAGLKTPLDAMLEAGIKRLVFSSTCAVYGEPASMPITEELPLEPVNPYGDLNIAFERALVRRSLWTTIHKPALLQCLCDRAVRRRPQSGDAPHPAGS